MSELTNAHDCPPTGEWGSLTFIAAKQAAGASDQPDSAIAVLEPVPVTVPPATAARELRAAGVQFLGEQVPLDDPADLGRSESRADLVARVRALVAGQDRPVALGFGEAAGVRYLGGALVHGRFDATTGSLFGAAIASRFRADRPTPPVPAPAAGSDDAARISQRSVAAWRRAVHAIGGVARSESPKAMPRGVFLRLPRGKSAEPGGGLVPVLDAIGRALAGAEPRLIGVLASNRHYPDLENFTGMAAQPGPIVLDDAVTGLSREARHSLLHRRLLAALRSARWCPGCLDAELGQFDSTLRDLLADTLIVNDLRQLDLELEDVLDQVPGPEPVELADWPFHQGGSAFAVATDAAGDTILALRSSTRALAGIEPVELLSGVAGYLISSGNGRSRSGAR